MNIWHDIEKERINPNDFYAVIEISEGSKNKYELDKTTGFLKLDRVLYTSTHYPANYGFIPRTLSDDGDPLDVLVYCSEKIAPMSIVRCYPIGSVTMQDDGDLDQKIIAIPFGEPMWNGVSSIEDLPPHLINEITHFFNVYKQLEFKSTAVLEIVSREKAEELVKQCIESYNEKFLKE